MLALSEKNVEHQMEEGILCGCHVDLKLLRISINDAFKSHGFFKCSCVKLNMALL